MMNERSAAESSQAAASERDVLLATKLRVPGRGQGLVSRPRLTRRLDEGAARGLVLVCAPAGYGKTVLLAGWAQRPSPPAAWLSLDAGDNDPARFWRHALAALDRALPGVAGRVSPLLGPPAPASFEPLVTALINELAARPEGDQVLLVLDDYHVIGAREVHASVDFLLAHRPAGLQLVLASRSDPPLTLALLRARGQLTEVRAADLQFTDDEGAALLRQVAAVPEVALPDETAAALTARTEGWAAGLQLAALSLRGQEDVTGFVTTFTGSHRYVLDFLAEEVLDRQDEELRAFLLETSVLERLSGPLCDALTGRAGGQRLLERIERSGLFLVPLDEVRGWWRYHHLFADLLRARLHAERPGQVAQLHRKAAAWCAERGLADDAIRHALAAGENTWAARLIEQHFDELFYLRGEGATVQHWLSALPADLVRSRPRLLLAQTALAADSGRVAEAASLVDAAEQRSAGAAGEPFEPSAGRAASLLVNIPAMIALFRARLAALRGEAGVTAASASLAMAEIREGERALDSIGRWHMGMAEWLHGLLPEAEHALSSSIAHMRAGGQGLLATRLCHVIGQIQQAQGRLDAAVRTCRQELELSVPPGRPAPPVAGAAHLGLAEVAYQRSELDAALLHVSEGIRLCRQLAYTPLLATGLATLAWIRQATGDPAGALDAIGEAERVSPGTAVTGLVNPVPAQRARLLLVQGDLDGAARWAASSGLGADDEPDYARERGHLVLARILLAQDQPGRALALLERLHAAARNRAGSRFEIGALRALALAAGGDEDGAVDALAEALTLACPQGFVRVFADEGPPLAALLGRLITAQRSGRAAGRVSFECLARLQRAFGAAPAAPGHRAGTPAPARGIIEPLTGRELEVLELLAAGMPNQVIARELVVSLDTVKKHVSHILGKLGAASRTEAVVRARQLAIIP
ncbi:MAG: LuxR C-terminal-related transcriptional regulator [Nocardiopsaceae bacterium]|jgi:LuxR family maltose regulon positive regulatory protein|nr:LuxR C-terminal-related transcriptional regulator [Nocardiopsaceae bacterium]